MRSSLLCGVVLNALLASAACPFMDGGGGSEGLKRRLEPEDHRQGQGKVTGDDGYLDKFKVDDGPNDFLTTDFGTPADDRNSLKAGARGPTLLEDFVLRTKITRFDHERIPERAGTWHASDIS